jgi:hypothetical protein
MAIGVGVASPAVGATRTDNFTSDPGWIGVRNIINPADAPNPSNFGFNPPADNSGATAPPGGGSATGVGEAGGKLSKRTAASGESGYYAADLGGFLNLSMPFSARGVMTLPDWGDRAFMGFFDSQPRRDEGSLLQNTTPRRPRFIGLDMDSTSETGGFNVNALVGDVSQVRDDGDSRLADGPTFKIGAGTMTGTNPPYHFTLDYGPNNTDNTGVFTVTLTDPTAGTRVDGLGGGGGTFVVNISSANRTILAGVGYDRFGISTAGGGSGGASSTQSLFLDDVTYTIAPVPEPVGLGLLGLAGGICGLRRHRRAR